MNFICTRFSSNQDIIKAGNNSPSLKQGARSEAVRIVQMALIDLGFVMPVSTANKKTLPDGIFGNETVRILIAFQRANGLVADGIVGAKTLARLDALLAVKSEITVQNDLLRGNKGRGRD